MKNQIHELLEKFYAHFKTGDYASALGLCSNEMSFQIPGKSKLAGKYTKDEFLKNYIPKLREISAGTFKIDVHDILVSDRHAVVLASESVTSHEKPVEIRTVHVWRLDKGQPVAWYEYPRDLYQFDSAWT